MPSLPSREALDRLRGRMVRALAGPHRRNLPDRGEEVGGNPVQRGCEKPVDVASSREDSCDGRTTPHRLEMLRRSCS